MSSRPKRKDVLASAAATLAASAATALTAGAPAPPPLVPTAAPPPPAQPAGSLAALHPHLDRARRSATAAPLWAAYDSLKDAVGDPMRRNLIMRKWEDAQLETVRVLYKEASPLWKEEADALLSSMRPFGKGGSHIAISDVQELILLRFEEHADLGLMLYLILRQGPAETNHRRSTTAQQLLQYIKSLAGDVSDISVPPRLLPEYLLGLVPPERVLRSATRDLLYEALEARSSLSTSRAFASERSTPQSSIFEGPLADLWHSREGLVKFIVAVARTSGSSELLRQLLEASEKGTMSSIDYELKITVSDNEADDIRAVSISTQNGTALGLRTSLDPLEYTVFEADHTSRKFTESSEWDGLHALAHMVTSYGAVGTLGVHSASRIDERATRDVAEKTNILADRSLNSRSFSDGQSTHSIPIVGGIVGQKPFDIVLPSPTSLVRRLLTMEGTPRWSLSFAHDVIFFGDGKTATSVDPTPPREPAYARTAAKLAPALRLQAAKVHVDVSQTLDLCRLFVSLAKAGVKSGYLDPESMQLTSAGREVIRGAAKGKGRGEVTGQLSTPDEESEKVMPSAAAAAAMEEAKYPLQEDAFNLFLAVVTSEYKLEKAPYSLDDSTWRDIVDQNPLTVNHAVALLREREKAATTSTSAPSRGTTSPPKKKRKHGQSGNDSGVGDASTRMLDLCGSDSESSLEDGVGAGAPPCGSGSGGRSDKGREVLVLEDSDAD